MDNASEAIPIVPPPTTDIGSADKPTEQYQYQWIINEGLLRDEGTLYGIAGAEVKDKLAAIHEYYRIKKASSQLKKDDINKRILDISNTLASVTAEIDQANKASASNASPDVRFYNLAPISLQLIAYIAICYFNYSLEKYWLSPVITSTFICLGLYLFGLFSVFLGHSIMYNSIENVSDEKSVVQPREKWKIYLEELGVPLIVSLFICVLPFQAHSTVNTLVATIFFFMLFLLGGKGLINTLFRLRKEVAFSLREIKTKREVKSKKKELAKKLEMQEKLSSDLQTEVCIPAAALEELEGEEEYRVRVFMSEYQLAYQGRQLLSNSQIKKFA